MSSRMRDWTGQKVNFLTVIEPAPNYAKEHNLKDKHVFWKCQCECGKICYLPSSRLSEGKVKSCGCKRDNKKDLTGKVFGRITVVNENKEETFKQSVKSGNLTGDRRIYWNCICNFCGHTSIRASNTFKNKDDVRCEYCRTVKDITGEKHGKLTAIKFVGKNHRHEALWECQCECGNKKILSSTLFHLVYSCGCSRFSIGEYHIKEILDKNNILYIHDTAKFFPDLISVKNSDLCRYDFIIINNDNEPVRLIEFDGIQHTDPSVGWYSLDTIANDKIKNKYAIENNIPLVRIPYTLRDTVTLEDIMGDKYLINEFNEQEKDKYESNLSRES